MFNYPFPEWNKLLWALCIAIEFVLEAIGLIRPQDATLTALIRATIPVWARAAILGWLAYHFLIQQSPSN